MILRNLVRGIIVLSAILCICGLLVWVVIPYIIIGWDCISPHYDHKIAVLSTDIECQVSGEGSSSQAIKLPMGLMLYSPCRHDFARMSLDERCTYKIYLKLDMDTIKSLIKDSDDSFSEKIHGIMKYGELEGLPDRNKPFLFGCQSERLCPKELSFLMAQEILQSSPDEDMSLKIKLCNDVDTLRIVAFAVASVAWTMEAGCNVDFDNKMESIVIDALKRLYDIGSDYALESIEYYKRAFPPDGAFSLFFNEMEKKYRERGVKEAQQ